MIDPGPPTSLTYCVSTPLYDSHVTVHPLSQPAPQSPAPPAQPPAPRPRQRRRVAAVLRVVVSIVIYVAGLMVSSMGLIGNPMAVNRWALTNSGTTFALLLLVLWATVFVRRRWPLVTYLTGCILALAWCDTLLMLVGLFHIIVRAPKRVALAAVCAGLAITTLGTLRLTLGNPENNPFSLTYLPTSGNYTGFALPPDAIIAIRVETVLFALIGLGVSIGAGFLVRRTGHLKSVERDAARQATRNSALATQIAQQSERELLAQELHDTLAHRLSLVSLHAGSLEVAVTDAQGAQAAKSVRSQAHLALEDLRSLVRGLRASPSTSPAAAPSLGAEVSLTGLASLIDSVADTGHPVHSRVIMQDVEFAPTLLQTSVYRVVQEALTNVVKHAPSQPVTVDVRVSANQGARVQITNPLVTPPARPPSTTPITTPIPAPGTELVPQGEPLHMAIADSLAATGTGAGVEGMKARADMLGGRAFIGVRNGQFVVDVTFPPFTAKPPEPPPS